MEKYHEYPDLEYTKRIELVDDSAIVSYEGISYDHFNTILSISRDLAAAGIAPQVLDADEDDATIVYERCYHIGRLPTYYEYKRFLEILGRLGICHTDILTNVMQTAMGNLVLIDFDQSFYIGHSNKRLLRAYASRYEFNDSEDLEYQFIRNEMSILHELDY